MIGTMLGDETGSKPAKLIAGNPEAEKTFYFCKNQSLKAIIVLKTMAQ